MTHGSLFSGIGGFDLAAEWAGWTNVFHCEINPFGQKVLKYYWPNAISYDDITKTDFTIHRGRIDVLTGGFPCQPFSVAGKRKGTADHRNLWPEYFRAIREIQPLWVVGENVPGLINWSGGMVFEQVQADLESEGYEVWPVILPACGVNAPHRRDRVWFVAYSESKQNNRRRQGRFQPFITRLNDQGTFTNANLPGCEQQNEQKFIGGGCNTPEFATYGKNGITPNTDSERWSKFNNAGQPKSTGRINCQFSPPQNWQNFPTQPPVCNGYDGIPTELLRQRIREDSLGLLSEKEINKIISKALTKHRNESIKAAGNAIVPQVAFQIFNAINQFNP